MNEATKNDNKLSNFLNVVKKSIESTENIIVLYKDADEKLAASFVSDNFTKDFVFIQYGNNLQFLMPKQERPMLILKKYANIINAYILFN